ncbi:MAG TPA: hypothetical protein VKV28_03190 [Candidatus Binataceae bacterium]|nr:hypothetical protein [Candidatus Binataceae bacterium]
MPVLNPDSYPWSLVSIRAHTPSSSGIYGIFAEQWIYLGQSDDIQAHLLSHFWGLRPCISQHHPLGFTFELVPYSERPQRLEQLRIELQPICNTPNSMLEGAVEALDTTAAPGFSELSQPLSRVMIRRLQRWWSEQRRRRLAPS